MRSGSGSSQRRDVLTKSQMVSVLYMWKKEKQFPVRKSSVGKSRETPKTRRGSAWTEGETPIEAISSRGRQRFHRLELPSLC